MDFSTTSLRESSVSPHPYDQTLSERPHDAILGGGHAGIEKTAAAVASRYHWPRMTDSITAWIRGCGVCHRVKHKDKRPYGLLQALPTPLERAERVNIDSATKLPVSESGYDACNHHCPTDKASALDPGQRSGPHCRKVCNHIHRYLRPLEGFADLYSVGPRYQVYTRLLAGTVLAAGYKAPDVHGIPPAVIWTGRKGECDSRDLLQGVHCTARKYTSLGPAITVGRGIQTPRVDTAQKRLGWGMLGQPHVEHNSDSSGESEDEMADGE